MSDLSRPANGIDLLRHMLEVSHQHLRPGWIDAHLSSFAFTIDYRSLCFP